MYILCVSGMCLHAMEGGTMVSLLCPPIPEFLHALCLSTFCHVREYLLPQSLLI